MTTLANSIWAGVPGVCRTGGVATVPAMAARATVRRGVVRSLLSIWIDSL
jgi:hypothetical protein